MRKPRAVIFDDEVFILSMLKEFFQMRGYEVLSYSDPTVVCPLLGADGHECRYERPCADVMITDFNMPGVNGVDLIDHQVRKGCRLDSRNKAVISGYIDDHNRRKVEELGCSFFAKPFTLYALAGWLAACEQRMDLSRPLASRRREERFDSYRDITFRLPETESVFAGIALNISTSGLCLRSPHPLSREDTISIDGGHFLSCQQASVRWVKQLDTASYLAGLHCC